LIYEAWNHANPPNWYAGTYADPLPWGLNDWCFDESNTKHVIGIDGSETTNNSALYTGAGTATQIHLNGSAYRDQMDMGELLIYTSALSVLDLAQVRGYLATKWGITI